MRRNGGREEVQVYPTEPAPRETAGPREGDDLGVGHDRRLSHQRKLGEHDGPPASVASEQLPEDEVVGDDLLT